MPIYEYKCRQCGDKFEKLVRSLVRPASSEDGPECPACGSQRVERQVSLCGCLTGSGAADSGAGSAFSSPCAPVGGG